MGIVLYMKKVIQGDRVLYSGGIKTKELLEIYKLDVWKPGAKNIHEQGCQREPFTSHFKKIGKKLVEEEALLPTSIIASAIENEGILEISDTGIPGIVKLEIREGKKLRITDGIHRIFGVDFAINELDNPDLYDFEFPIVIIQAKDRVDEILVFYEINSKAKNVATDLAQQLLNDLNNNNRKKLSKAEKKKLVALNIAMLLTDNPNSVWFKSISKEKNTGNTISSSTSFVGSLLPVLEDDNLKEFWESNKITAPKAAKDIYPLILDFWQAIYLNIKEAFPLEIEEKKKWVIQKTPGIYSWHLTLKQLLPLLIEEAKNKEQQIDELFIKQFLELYGGRITNPEFWQSKNKSKEIIGGEAAKYNSQKGFKELAELMYDEIITNKSINSKESKDNKSPWRTFS